MLADFWGLYPPAKGPMAAWYKVVCDADYGNFNAVRETFNSADKVGKYVIFDVGAGYRIVTSIHFNRGKLYIRHVFTHAEYERWSKRKGK